MYLWQHLLDDCRNFATTQESGENNFGDFSRLAGIGNATSTRVVANSFSHLFLLLCVFAPLREFPFSAMPIFQPAHFIFQPLQERLAV
ncbi:hypothetical protein [Lignipirellula cremea]|uniref:hypothetical protein n=1 Tax=Lignipirellula cremea TaxID=2528010 RepID=UPI00119F688F|nr:hypothetical protein [Lignipirellula cremea]